MARCAFLGLGVMGAPMAGYLAKAGHSVNVWNRSPEKADAWIKKYKKYKVDVAPNPERAVWSTEYVFMCLGDDPDVKAVFEAFEPAVGGGMVIVDHTTASADLARELAKRSSTKGAAFIDAPVSGGQAGAENGQLTIMCGGEEKAFTKAAPLMDVYAKQMTLIGGSGAGQLAKMVNQICIAGVVQGLSEALAFAKNADLDVPKVVEAISKGAAQSWQMENRWETMVEDKFDFGFAVDWMRKDLRIALEEAKHNGSDLPLTKLVDEFYAEVQSSGGARWDTSSLISRLPRG